MTTLESVSLHIGTRAHPDGGVWFRVWAPKRRHVSLVIEDGAGAPDEIPLHADEHGYHSGHSTSAAPGTRYRYRLDGESVYPDPASRFQPDGPHGPSEIVDPQAFPWTDHQWGGLSLYGQIFYEMHVGTFTRDGTWSAAERELPALAQLGVTAIEMMPVADFPGRFGWGYDGVSLFAPTRLYGDPDDLRRFVDRAHSLGIGVVLDVVYNHFGPDGCYLREFADEYFSTLHTSEWGETPNFDGRGCAPVREFFLANAAYWIDEFHFDGLRLDATQSVHDDSTPHILLELGQQVRRAARGRHTLVVNENEPQHARFVRPVDRGGYGLDMIWNDDWHHSAIVALTGHDEGYLTDYRGSAQEFVSSARYGFLYQGQWYRWQHQRRGTPAFDLEPARFVHFIENHDQTANTPRGERSHADTSPGRWRALTALLLLGPQTPMLFQGQEWATSAPFLFFADHDPELARRVASGRRDFLAQFANLARREMQSTLSPPHDLDTFVRCKLDHEERNSERSHASWQLHRDLLRLRRTDACFSRQVRPDGAVLSADTFVLRFFGSDGDDRLLVVNLGRTLHLDPAPEPLLAPPDGALWTVMWSSQDSRYGGVGTLTPDAPESDRDIPNRPDIPRPWENWRVQAETAFVLASHASDGESSSNIAKSANRTSTHGTPHA